MVVLDEVALIIRLHIHDAFGGHPPEPRTTHPCTVICVPGLSTGFPDGGWHCQHGNPSVAPHGRQIADPDFPRRLFDVFHLEFAHGVSQIVILSGAYSGRLVVTNTELAQALQVVIALVLRQRQHHQALGRVLALFPVGDCAKSGPDASPELVREIGTQCLDLLIEHHCLPGMAWIAHRQARAFY